MSLRRRIGDFVFQIIQAILLTVGYWIVRRFGGHQTAEGLVWRARRAVAEGKCQFAIWMANGAVASDPTWPIGYTTLAYAYQCSEDYEKAKDVLRQAVHRFPKNSTAWEMLGSVEYKLQDNPAAKASYQHALELRPDSVRAVIGWGLADLTLGNFDGAAEAFRRAVALHPDDVEDLATLGRRLIAVKNYEAAFHTLDHAAHLQPRRAVIRYNLGVSLAHLKRYDDALVHAQRAVDLAPDNADYRAFRDDTHTVIELLRTWQEFSEQGIREVLEFKVEECQAVESIGVRVHGRVERGFPQVDAKVRAKLANGVQMQAKIAEVITRGLPPMMTLVLSGLAPEDCMAIQSVSGIT